MSNKKKIKYYRQYIIICWCILLFCQATSPEYEDLLSNFLKTKVAIKYYAEWTFGSVNIEDIHQVLTQYVLY